MGRQVYGALNDGYRNLYYAYKETLKDKAPYSEGGLKGGINRLVFSIDYMVTDG